MFRLLGLRFPSCGVNLVPQVPSEYAGLGALGMLVLVGAVTLALLFLVFLIWATGHLRRMWQWGTLLFILGLGASAVGLCVYGEAVEEMEEFLPVLEKQRALQPPLGAEWEAGLEVLELFRYLGLFLGLGGLGAMLSSLVLFVLSWLRRRA